MLCRAATQMPRSPGSEARQLCSFDPRFTTAALTAGFAGILHTDHRLCCEILQQRRSTDHLVSRGLTVRIHLPPAASPFANLFGIIGAHDTQWLDIERDSTGVVNAYHRTLRLL
jgi:hypothetical protein